MLIILLKIFIQTYAETSTLQWVGRVRFLYFFNADPFPIRVDYFMLCFSLFYLKSEKISFLLLKISVVDPDRIASGSTQLKIGWKKTRQNEKKFTVSNLDSK